MEAKTVHTATPIALPLVGMKDGAFQESPWTADTEERCAMPEWAPIVDANGETVALLVHASDSYENMLRTNPLIEQRAAFFIRACNSFNDLVAIVKDAQSILAANLPPDGQTDHQTIGALLEIFDGPRSRAALAAAESA